MSILVALKDFEAAVKFYSDLGFKFVSKSHFRYPRNSELWKLVMYRPFLESAPPVYHFKVTDLEPILKVLKVYNISYDIDLNEFTDPYGTKWWIKVVDLMPSILEWNQVSHDVILHSHRGIIHKDHIYLFYGSNFIFDFVDQVIRVNLDTYQSSPIELNNQEHPSARSQQSCVLYQEKVFFFGGFDIDFQFKGDLWTYDLNSNRFDKIDLDPSPGPRRYHSSAVIGKNLYIFGGEQEVSYNVLDHINELWCLDMETLVWKQIESKNDKPHPRRYSTLDAVQKELYLFAGRDDFVRMNDMWCFDPFKNEWFCLLPHGEVPLPRSGHASVVFRNSIFYTGGNNGNDPLDFEIFEYNVNKNFFKKLTTTGTLPRPRYWHIAVLKGAIMYIHGGKDDRDEWNDILQIELPIPEKKLNFSYTHFVDVIFNLSE